jgi:hypothetical protein
MDVGCESVSIFALPSGGGGSSSGDGGSGNGSGSSSGSRLLAVASDPKMHRGLSCVAWNAEMRAKQHFSPPLALL